jgi:uncharacterized protein (DUF1330 family)
MIVVAIMTVRKNEIEKFRSFESKAAAIMASHGGVIERTVVIPLPISPELFKELHIVTFPSEQAFAAYRQDKALQEVAHLRAESVVETEILVGETGPNYEAV